MIESLIGTSLRYRVAVLGATLLLGAAGTWALANINYDAFPDLTPNQVQVITVAAGLSPAEVENLVSYPMETAMMGLPRTRGVRSISKAGISVVTVSYEDDVDMYFARAQVQQRMQDAVGSLPAGYQPSLGPPATPMGEVFQYLIESKTLSLMEIRTIHEYTIKPLLRTVPGVAEVNTWGGMVQQYQVLTDPSKLAGYGLTLNDLETALEANNGNFGAGYIEDRGERFTVRGLGRLADTTEIGDVVVATRSGGTPVHVHDVARVGVGPMPREGAVSRDGRGETLSGMIVMLKGANGKEVVTRVKARLQEIEPLLPSGVSIRPFYNQGDVVDRTTATVTRNLIEGALLVGLVLFLFLRNLRASLITASVIPLATLFGFMLMKYFDVSANLMSLGALDFGLIVDASVVMVENFVRRLGEAGRLSEPERHALIRKAAFEVGRPIVFGVCIIIAVYIPIFTLEGLEGRMFKPMAFTVCVAVLGSLLLALTYVPMLASFLLKNVEEKPSRGCEALLRKYSEVLSWALTHSTPVVGTAMALLVLALGSVPFLGTEFMPKLDEGSMLIETRRIPSTSLPQGMSIAREVERTLLQFPEVRSIVTKMGRPELATETMGLYAGDVYVMFKPKGEWKAPSTEALIVRMDSALSQIPGIDYNFTAPMAMRLDEAISGVRTELGVKVFGDSLPILEQKAAEIRDVISAVPGAADVSVDASEVIDGRKRFPVVVRLADEYRGTPEAIGQLLLTTPSGGRVTLSQVAT